MKRKYLLIGTIIALLMLTLCCALAEDGNNSLSGSCGIGVNWTLSDGGTLTISGTGAMSNYTSETSAPWENHKSRVKALVVENGVTSLGDRAFSSCAALEAISLPEGLLNIGRDSF